VQQKCSTKVRDSNELFFVTSFPEYIRIVWEHEQEAQELLEGILGPIAKVAIVQLKENARIVFWLNTFVEHFSKDKRRGIKTELIFFWWLLHSSLSRTRVTAYL
jgi:hypothetical protein